MKKLILILIIMLTSVVTVYSQDNTDIEKLYEQIKYINISKDSLSKKVSTIEYIKDKSNRGVCTREDVVMQLSNDKLIEEYESDILKIQKEIDSLESRLDYTESMIERYNRMNQSVVTSLNSIITSNLGKSYDLGGSVSFAKPLESLRVTSEYGMRLHPIFRRETMHTGIDLGGYSGMPIYSVERGVVIKSDYSSSYGNNILVMHPNGYFSFYAHIRNGGVLVNKGDIVDKGQQIAEMGSTGWSTGDHLHFELYEKGKLVNPEKLIRFR